MDTSQTQLLLAAFAAGSVATTLFFSMRGRSAVATKTTTSTATTVMRDALKVREKQPNPDWKRPTADSATAAAAAAAAAAAGVLPKQKQAAEQESPPFRKKNPNIVIMLADDMGWGDMPDKTEALIMPNIEKMWQNGMRLTRMYAASPVCSPTRASVLTGMHPQRHTITNPNANGSMNDGNVRESFNQQYFTLPEALKLKCYKTGLWGKWHLGNLRVDNSVAGITGPGSQGFDDWLVTVRSVDMVDSPDMFDSNLANHKHCDRMKGQSAQVVMRRAVHLIQEAVAGKTPFFTMTWFHEPHTPIQATEQHLKLYEGVDERKKGHPGITYMACLSAVDEAIGTLRNELRRLNVEKDTLVWFTSDNGPVKNGASTGGLEGAKFNTLEGGLRVPSVLEWPGVIRPGRVIDTPISVMDIYPTVLDIIGGSGWKPHEKYRRESLAKNSIDGISVRGIITEEPNYPLNLDKMIPIKFRDMYGMIDRKNGWKWGQCRKNEKKNGGGRVQLSNLANGNLAEGTSINGQVASRMKAAYEKWCKTTVDGC